MLHATATAPEAGGGSRGRAAAGDGGDHGGRRLLSGIGMAVTGEGDGRRPRRVEAAVADGGSHEGWKRPWLGGGGRSGRRLPRRMEVAMTDGTAPSADGGNCGGAAATDRAC